MPGYLAPLLHICLNLSWNKVQNYQEFQNSVSRTLNQPCLVGLSLSARCHPPIFSNFLLDRGQCLLTLYTILQRKCDFYLTVQIPQKPTPSWIQKLLKNEFSPIWKCQSDTVHLTCLVRWCSSWERGLGIRKTTPCPVTSSGPSLDSPEEWHVGNDAKLLSTEIWLAPCELCCRPLAGTHLWRAWSYLCSLRLDRELFSSSVSPNAS